MDKISESEKLKSIKRVFHKKKIIIITELPDLKNRCPKVVTLLLQGNPPLERIQDGFLQVFESLRILNIGGTNIQSLPESILHLGNLRVLILRRCDRLERLPQLGALSKLQELDCHFAGIKELPIGMQGLSKLRRLDLSCTLKL